VVINVSSPIYLGVRQKPSTGQPRRLMTSGESTSGDVLKYDTGFTRYDIPLHFGKVSEANMLLLQAYLIENSDADITVALDSGDTLGLGLTGTVSLLYVAHTFRWEYRYGSTYRVWFTLRHRTG
jgi:hypothetical protein